MGIDGTAPDFGLRCSHDSTDLNPSRVCGPARREQPKKYPHPKFIRKAKLFNS